MNDTGSPTLSPRPRTLAIGQLLALLADGLLVSTGSMIADHLERRFGMHLAILAMGAGLAVISMTAAWLALGPLATSFRLLAAPLVGLGALLLATIPLAISGARPEAVIGVFLAGIAQFLMLQAPYWLLRSWHRLRIASVDELEKGAMERLQYSLWQMLLVMTLVAVSLGIGRGVLALAATSRGSRGVEPTLVGFFVLLVGYNLLLAWPLVWAVLSPSGFAWKIASAVILEVLVVVVAYPVTTSVLGGSEGHWIYWLAFAPQGAFLLTHLLAVRFSGYRLVRLM